jgi:hypothetical protein
MNKPRLFISIILFGSLWGFSEVIFGSIITDAGYPSGGIMTGFFAIPILILTRMIYKQPGMQIGMGLVAGSLRVFNPFVGCQICSAIAIMAEGIIFELIFIALSTDFKELKRLTMQSSMGIISAYIIFVSGYIVTQILTPIFAGAGFYLENLVIFVPNILAEGIIPALIASLTVPLIISLKKLDFSLNNNKLYYPITAAIIITCWTVVIGSWLMFAA